MRIKKEFILREIAGEYILIPTGSTTQEFNGLITINDVAAFVWKNIEKVNSVDELISMVLDEYDVDEDVARNDIEEFIQQLKKAEMIA